MQKKKNLPDTSSSSAWQDNIKKQQKTQDFKKYIIWGGIIGVIVLALVGLLYFTGKSTSSPLAGKTEQNLPPVTAQDITVGDAKAKVTITEYGDMQCPACAAYNPLVNEVLDTYKGQVRLVYRFFPLPQHQNAIVGAHAAYAAWKLGKFPEMKDMMFDNQKDWETLSDADAQSKFTGYAKNLGMDQAKFKTIMNGSEAKAFVEQDKAEAASLGLMSTPTFFIGNKFVTPQSLQDFKTVIDEQLKSK